MKKTILTAASLLILSGCATMNKSVGAFDDNADKSFNYSTTHVGKSPKEVAGLLGEPATAGFDNEGKYAMAYPMTERSMNVALFLVQQKSLKCAILHFDKSDNGSYKFNHSVTSDMCDLTQKSIQPDSGVWKN